MMGDELVGDYEMIPGEIELWRGRQWAVTTHSLNRYGERGGYWISIDRLAEEMPDYSWFEHMVKKPGIDLEDFVAAFCVACTLLQVPIKHDLRPHIERARQKLEQGREETAAFQRKLAVWLRDRGREGEQYPPFLRVSEIDAMPDPATQD